MSPFKLTLPLIVILLVLILSASVSSECKKSRPKLKATYRIVPPKRQKPKPRHRGGHSHRHRSPVFYIPASTHDYHRRWPYSTRRSDVMPADLYDFPTNALRRSDFDYPYMQNEPYGWYGNGMRSPPGMDAMAPRVYPPMWYMNGF